MHTGALGKVLSGEARGKFGYSGGFGRIAFGYTRFGFYNWYAGIYQKKYYFGKPYISRMKFYRPKNNQKPTQQLWRGVFKDGKAQYDLLSDEQKLVYKKRGILKHITGYNIFMSEWLFAHKNILN
jgi:hypothetical protein